MFIVSNAAKNLVFPMLLFVQSVVGLLVLNAGLVAAV